MKPKLLSFDAAGTLVNVNWQPGRFAVECAFECGFKIDPQIGRERYDRLLQTRWPQYCLANQTQDDSVCDAFWLELATDWIGRFKYDETHAHHLVKVANSRLHGEGQTAFQLYDDVLPCLNKLKQEGWRMVILSNWDYSLHRIVKNLGIADYFEHVFASLQEGPEKPDPALFQIVCDRTGIVAGDIIHIGDNPVDDVEGARDAGWRPIFLDRNREDTTLPTISTLRDVARAIQWLS